MADGEKTEEERPFVERVAALDIGKASLVACLRVPSETRPGRRCGGFPLLWTVPLCYAITFPVKSFLELDRRAITDGSAA